MVYYQSKFVLILNKSNRFLVINKPCNQDPQVLQNTSQIFMKPRLTLIHKMHKTYNNLMTFIHNCTIHKFQINMECSNSMTTNINLRAILTNRS